VASGGGRRGSHRVRSKVRGYRRAWVGWIRETGRAFGPLIIHITVFPSILKLLMDGYTFPPKTALNPRDTIENSVATGTIIRSGTEPGMKHKGATLV
jgi:hypothetical protein